jgi:hypothetical protein
MSAKVTYDGTPLELAKYHYRLVVGFCNELNTADRKLFAQFVSQESAKIIDAPTTTEGKTL